MLNSEYQWNAQLGTNDVSLSYSMIALIIKYIHAEKCIVIAVDLIVAWWRRMSFSSGLK